MRAFLYVAVAVGLFVGGAYLLVPSPTSARPGDDKPERKATGIEKRELWTTSKVKGSPEPPDPFIMVKAYPKLTFNEALELAAMPGKNAWLVAERPGKIY